MGERGEGSPVLARIWGTLSSLLLPPYVREQLRDQAGGDALKEPSQAARRGLAPPQTSLPFLLPRLLLPVPARLCLAPSSPRDGHCAPSSHTTPLIFLEAILTPPTGVPDLLLALSRSLRALPLLLQGEGPNPLHPCPRAHTDTCTPHPVHTPKDTSTPRC